MLGFKSMLYRILAVVALVSVVVGLVAVAIQQYSAKKVAQAAQESVKEAVREAVVERKEAVKVDVAQTAARATATREVASVVISHREKSKEVISHYETSPDCSGRDADRLRVLIDAAREINRVIDSTPSLP